MKNKVPEQHSGAKSDTISEIVLADEATAAAHFMKVKSKFLAINSWELLAGEEKASFSLRDSGGELLLSKPKEGDFIRIKIPGLNNPTGDGYDWVMVEKFEENTEDSMESVFIRVRPTSDPTKPDDKTAHFFCEKATSNFIIRREGRRITAEVHGRNEEPNTEDLSTVEKIRNFLVAVGGIIAGSKFQWKSLTQALIKIEE